MKNFSATKFYALAFGLFLGLCIWKFGNPVILDHIIAPPASPAEFIHEAWPLRWANWILLPLAIIGGILAFKNRRNIAHPLSSILIFLPLAWLGWQFVSATQTVDASLTTATLWQFCGCVACYFLGALLFSNRTAQSLLLIGILAAFTFCLIRAVDQRLFEFPLNHQVLIEGERSGWTNFPPESVAEMKLEHIVITTNGVDVANPVILEKFRRGRVAGTLVYPNALAGLILLLFPVALVLAQDATNKLKCPIRMAVIALTIFLGGAAFFWSGSKLGWLIGLGLIGLFLLRLDWPRKVKFAVVAIVLVAGLGVFAVRFQHYFASGATSTGARLDYWRAAAQTTMAKPVWGSGPGTFQRPYSQLKAPESEMARLTHNDYLEQFSDSGIPGGVAYAAWIVLALAFAMKKFWRDADRIGFALFAGVLAWFIQGVGEFGLYIPALAWTTFTLLGALVPSKINQFDNKTAHR
jgi:O-antigen ligase